MPSQAYIQTADQVILDSMELAINNLSDMLEDTSGRMGIREVYFILKNLKLSPTGGITGVATANTTSQDSKLGAETFAPVLSFKARELYPKITRLDKLLIEFQFDPESDICVLMSRLNDEISSYMSYVYLESYSLYTSLVEFRVGDIFALSIPEIDRVLNNLRFITTKIGAVGNKEEVYSLLHVVNYVQRAILFIRRDILLILR